MGRHVDTTRPEDAPTRAFSMDASPFPLHRKDDTVRTDIRVMLDAWSGNADTDRAWSYEYQFGPVPDQYRM